MSKKIKNTKSKPMALITCLSLVLTTSPMTFAGGKKDDGNSSSSSTDFTQDASVNTDLIDNQEDEGHAGSVNQQQVSHEETQEDSPHFSTQQANQDEEGEPEQSNVNTIENGSQVEVSPEVFKNPSNTPLTRWKNNPNAPEWFKLTTQQGDTDGRKIYRGTSSFMQCTEFLELEWEDQLSPGKLHDSTAQDKWAVEFSKLYSDYVLSQSNEGLNHQVQYDQEVYDFLKAAGSTRACLVKTGGLKEKHFINDSFNFTGTVDQSGTGTKSEINCSGTFQCAKYLNESSYNVAQINMVAANDQTAIIKEEVVNNYMQTIAANAQNALDQAAALYDSLKDCEVYAASTAGFDYTDPIWNNRNQKSTYDKKITCYSVGVETQDYPACASMVTAYDAIFAGRIVVDEVQKLDYQGHAMDAQTNLASTVGSDATAALKFQKDDLKKRADMQNQKATIEGAALGTLTKFYNEMPDREDIKTKCSENTSIETFKKIHKYYAEYTTAILNKLIYYHYQGYIELRESDDDSGSTESSFAPNNFDYCGKTGTLTYEAPVVTYRPGLATASEGSSYVAIPLNEENTTEGYCEAFVDQGRNSLVMNTEAKDGMKAAMIQAGVDVAKYLGQAALLNKQAGKIDTAVKQVEAFQPTDVTFETDTPNSLDCFKNPEAEGCVIDNDGTLDFYDGTINLGGSGAGTISGGSGSGGSGAVSDSSSPADRSDAPMPIGTPMAKANKGSGDFESKPAGAIGMKKSGGGAGAAGGGGGGAGAVAPPGGGGGAKGAGGSPGYRGSKAQKLSYSGGGSSLNYSSGSRRSKRSTKKATNPLSKLFGKKKGKGGVLNFRDTASSKQIRGKNGDLFQMISNRYNTVSKHKRLEEYENVK